MKRKWRGLLVAVAAAALLMFAWAPLACGYDLPGPTPPPPPAWLALGQSAVEDCPDGLCPAPQRVSARGGNWQGSVSSRVHGTAPEYVVQVSSASGVLIYKDAQKGVILTAYHVVEGGPRTGIPVVFPDGEKYQATAIDAKDSDAIVKDALADLALLVIPSPRANPCNIAMNNPKPGDRLTICGYGTDRRYATTAATMRGYVREPGQPELGSQMVEMAGEAKPGDSGGPIVNSAGGLVAVVSGSTWNRPRASDSTYGGYVDKIKSLCEIARFWAPWNARTEQEQIRADAAIEQERIRAGAQPQYIMPGGSGGPDPGLLSRVSQLEVRVAENERVAAAAKVALADAETKAGKAMAEALGIKEGITKAVGEEVEKVTPGIAEKIKDRVSGVITVIPWLKYGGIGLGLGVLYLLFRTSGKRVSEGGKSWGERFTDATPWTWDDRAGELWSKGIGMGYNATHPQAAAAAAAQAAAAQQQVAPAPIAQTPQQAAAAAQAAGYVVTPPQAPPVTPAGGAGT